MSLVPWCVFNREENQMLVLSRHVGQQIMLGDNITVTVVDIQGDKIRIGVDAPKEMPVHRREVYEAINGPPGS